MYISNFIVAILALGALVFGVPLEKRQVATSIAAAPLFANDPNLVPPPAILGPYGLKSLTPSSITISTSDASTTKAASATDTTSIAAAPLSIALPSLVPPPAMLGPYSLQSLTLSSTSVSTQVPSITGPGQQLSTLAAIASNSAPSTSSAPTAAKAKSDVVGKIISKLLTALHGLLRI
ncbi:hypothetical protein DIS24_g11155 [Lasiodiplodia hormozganensis]|uniref:Uncharacterized protein n=1 Tax=Lasiodiplodia hormozganensis TaxID=869390 RepID=A0AA39WZI1_9PEZI|nr:hypothetical protein DIS24_g11155 [Lasiodiplodia hormozganensis]